MAEVDRFAVLDAAQDDPRLTGETDHGADFLVHLLAAVHQLGMPKQFDQVGAQAFAVDHGHGVVGEAVETNAIPLFLHEFTGKEIGAEIGENIHLLHLDDHHAAPAGGDALVEGRELRGQERGDVEIDADFARDRDGVGSGKHGQHALVQGLGQVPEQPPVGQQVDPGQQRFAQIPDRDEQLAEHRLGHHVSVDAADALSTHQVGKVGALEGRLDPAQHLRRQGLALVLSGFQRCPGVRPGVALARPPLFHVDQPLGQMQDFAEIRFHMVPGGEIPAVGFLFQKRVVAEQEAHLLDRGLHPGLRLPLVDEDKVRAFENEELPHHLLDQGLETVGGGADVLAAAVERPETRKMDVNGPAPFLVPLEAVDVIQKQVFLAGEPTLGFLERHHGYMSTRDRGLDGPPVR